VSLSCADATVGLGVYVVGALDHTERTEIEAHLAICPACRDELAALAPLPGLMSRLSVEEVEAGPPPVDDAMLDRLLGAADRERRSDTRRRWIAVAASVVLLAGGTVGAVSAWEATHGNEWPRYEAQRGQVHLNVTVSDDEGGTKLEMALWGVAPEQRCSIIAVSRTGRSEVAGWWEATYAGTAKITGSTSIARAELTELRVVTDKGTTLLTADVSAD
jgi:predicted anti-sigma-YlaC factor YlaD